MVVGVRVGDAKADRYFVQERDGSVRPPDCREIVPQAEDELISPGAQSVAGKEGAIGSTFGIRAHDQQPLSRVALAVDPVELDGQSRGWPAVDCIEYVRGEASRHWQCLLIGPGVTAYAPRRMARVSRP